jgi:hypothetical protein
VRLDKNLVKVHPQLNLFFSGKVQHFIYNIIRATLNEGPRSRVQWNKAILSYESHKLDPHPLNEIPRPKSGKSKLNLHGTISKGK